MELDEVRHLITYRCNLRCRHCYLSADAVTPETGTGFKLTQSLLDNFYSFYRPKVVSATGGEPALEKETVFMLARSTALYGGVLELVTNGWFIDAGFVKDLISVNPATRFQISLDGPADYHNSLRCSPEAFDRAMTAIDAASASGATTKVRLTACDNNKDLLPEMVRILDSYRRSNIILVVRPVLSAGRAEKNGMRWSSDLKPLLSLEGTGKHVQIRTTDIHDPCTCGVRTVAVDPMGDIYPCTYLMKDRAWRIGGLSDPRALKEHPAFKSYKGQCYARSLAASGALQTIH